jgi:hypothetical protein
MDLHVPQTLLIAVRGYPLWLVVVCGVIAAAFALWIVLKLLKVGLWLALIALVVGGAYLVIRDLVR